MTTMFASKQFSNSSNMYQINQPQQQQLFNLNNSIDSNASLNSTSNSLLTAANTIIFNSPTNSSFNGPSPSSQLFSPASNNKEARTNASSFSNLLQMHQQNGANYSNDASNELDFDLHFLNNDINNSANESEKNAKKNSSLNDPMVFNDLDDDDLFINSSNIEDLDGDVIEDDNTNSDSIISLNNNASNRMKEPPTNANFRSNQSQLDHIINSNNLVATKTNNQVNGFQFKKPSLAVNFPIDQLNAVNQNENVNGVANRMNETSSSQNSNTKVNFSYQNTESLSPNSHNLIGVSTTPSNLTDSTPQNSVTSKYNNSRTYMKLQLQKKQTEEMEQKQRLTIASNQIFSSGSSSTASNTSSTGLNNHELVFLIQNNQNTHTFAANSNSISNNQNNNNNNTTQNGSNNSNGTNNFSMSLNSETTIPSSLPSSEIIPRNVLSEVFQIETKLEYPTKYHVMQMAKNLQQSTVSKSGFTSPNKIKKISSTKLSRLSNKPSSFNNQQSQQSIQQQQQPQYFLIKNNNSANNQLNYDTSFSASDDIAVLPTGSSAYSDAGPQEIFSNQSFDSKSSSWNQTRSPTSVNSSFSQNDIISELEDLVPEELNSYLNKKLYVSSLTSQEMQQEINQIEQFLNLPKTLPNEGIIQPYVMSPPLQEPIHPSSCPADIARLKKLQSLNLTEEDVKLFLRDRQKKDTHNMIERRRRFNINDRIKELGTILPKSSQSDMKLNKGTILKASVDYIKFLENELKRTKEIDDKFRQMTLINKQLVHRIKELEIHQHNTNNDTTNFEVQQVLEAIKKEPITNKMNNLLIDQRKNKAHQQQLPQRIPELRVNQTDTILSDAKILEEILNSPMQQQQIKQNDPFLGHTNVYDDNIMDSFN